MKTLSVRFEEVKLTYFNKIKASDWPYIKGPEEASNVLRSNWDMSQTDILEESKLLLMDNQSRLMSVAHLSKGGLTETIVDPRVVFTIALKRRAHSIILAHNHPSGGLEPSRADIELTKTLYLIGRMLRLPLEDHIIIANNDYCSMLNNGYMDGFCNLPKPPTPITSRL